MYIHVANYYHEICWTQVKKEWRQVNEKIRIVEKVKETSSDTGVHNRAITVLYT